jgi:uncharacterized RDD family membrane protein YckC
MKPVPAHIVKRTLAGVIDAAVLIFLALTVYAFITIPIVNQFIQGNELTAALAEKQLASFLFVEDDNRNIQPVTAGQYPEALYRYYVESNVSHLSLTKDGYYQQILKRGETDSLFDFSQAVDLTQPWLVPAANDQVNAIEKFYKDTYYATVDLFEATPAMQAISMPLNQRLLWSLVITFTFAGIGVYILMPLSFPQGATLGQRLWKIFLVHSEDLPLKQTQIVVKGLATLLFLVFGTFFLLPFISYIIMLNHKKRLSIPDFFAVTQVVEKHPIYR